MDSPQMILKIAKETGRVGAFGWEELSSRLLKNEKFMQALAKTGALDNDLTFQDALGRKAFYQFAKE
jgi:hypothetical protein